MVSVGIDIGTTTICACVLDGQTGEVLQTWTQPHGFLPSENSWARIQDVTEIEQTAEQILRQIVKTYPQILCLGLTGQMHGILYVDNEGNPLSPLMTWQDQRGNLPVEGSGMTYAQKLTELTGYPCAAGYGAVTHYYNLCNGLVPEKASCICTIHDYLMMRLGGLSRPVIHPSDAASLGVFDVAKGAFDQAALAAAGIDSDIFPEVSPDAVARTGYGFPVAVAIGDSQACFQGAVRDPEESVLVNIGTGSQISCWVDTYAPECPVETRPYTDGKYMFCGAALCGGRSYAILEGFFRTFLTAAGYPGENVYEVMNQLAAQAQGEPLQVKTTFCGTRQDPSLRGSIGNIGTDNFSPANLTAGFLQGCADELYEAYEQLIPYLKGTRTYLVGSGNGLRKNPVLQKLFEKTFRMKLLIPAHKEEAAYGAAIFAMLCVMPDKDPRLIRELIRYR